MKSGKSAVKVAFFALKEKKMQLRFASPLVLALALAACGGGDGDAPAPGPTSTPTPTPRPTPTPTPTTTPTPGTQQFPPSETLANVCTADGERRFIRSHMDEIYLWYSEIRDSAANVTGTVEDYFNSLRIATPDHNGKPKDRFSYIRTLQDNEKRSPSGPSYGVYWTESQPRRVAYVLKDSPAERAGLKRGAQLVNVLAATYLSWYRPPTGASVTFTVRDTPTSAEREITLRAANVVEDPLPLSKVVQAGGRQVGYVQFNTYEIDNGQDRLIDTLSALQRQGISDVVLDLRYNGGGWLYQAWSLASMLGGSRVQGKAFVRMKYNDKRQEATHQGVVPFTTQVGANPDGGTHAVGSALPQLSLPRVYVLATGWTCSASEATINGLRGAGVEVVLIGSTTCGKPYGFIERKNCGKAIAAIEVEMANEVGYGGYTDGFAPTCAVADDLSHERGDAAEGLLAAALHHIQTGSCPAKSAEAAQEPLPQAAAGGIDMDFQRPELPGVRLLPADLRR